MCFTLALNFACSSTGTANTNSANVSATNQVDSTNLPPGFSTSPIPPSANTTPGIPDPANANKVSLQNVPGIDPSKIGKTPQPKNTPPIPGIPDQETLKTMMSDAGFVNTEFNNMTGGIVALRINTVLAVESIVDIAVTLMVRD